jgi:hypothetical protein
MGMLPARMCSKCHQTAVAGGRYCAQHQPMPRLGGSHGTRDPRYQTALWRRWTRQAVLSRDPVCAFVTMGSRCPRLASAIHHVIDAITWTAQGGDFNDTENLCGLCKEHHDQIRNMPYGIDCLALPWRRGK